MANDSVCKKKHDDTIQNLKETLQRNHYFRGKLMSVSDFELEQEYFRRKLMMANRLIHGSGVVWGLEVKPTTTAKEFQVSPGLALDGLGREIVVEEGFKFTVKKYPSYLYLSYKECLENRQEACDVGSGEGCEYGKIAEGYEPGIKEEPNNGQDIKPCPSNPKTPADLDKCCREYIGQIKVPNGNTEVLIAEINGPANIFQYPSIVHNNPLLYELLEQHITSDHTKGIETINTIGPNAGNFMIEGKKIDGHEVIVESGKNKIQIQVKHTQQPVPQPPPQPIQQIQPMMGIVPVYIEKASEDVGVLGKGKAEVEIGEFNSIPYFINLKVAGWCSKDSQNTLSLFEIPRPEYKIILTSKQVFGEKKFTIHLKIYTDIFVGGFINVAWCAIPCKGEFQWKLSDWRKNLLQILDITEEEFAKFMEYLQRKEVVTWGDLKKALNDNLLQDYREYAVAIVNRDNSEVFC